VPNAWRDPRRSLFIRLVLYALAVLRWLGDGFMILPRWLLGFPPLSPRD